MKLADFGNAAVLSTAGTVSKVMPVGTPDYIAPEVLQCLQGGHCKVRPESCCFGILLCKEININNA